jgi:hypothetical protein
MHVSNVRKAMEETRRGYRPRCMSYSMVVTSMEKGESGYVSGGGTGNRDRVSE